MVPAWFTTAPETEVLTALAFLLFAGMLLVKWRRRQWGLARISAVHLLAGGLGILTIQVTLSIFEGNLGHRSHPSEIKEFLFSACFLAFSCRTALPGLGSALARFRLPQV